MELLEREDEVDDVAGPRHLGHQHGIRAALLNAVGKMVQDDVQAMLQMEDRIRRRIKGQDYAIAALADDEAFFATNALLLRNPSVVNFLDGCALSLPCHRPGEMPVGLMVWGGLWLRDPALRAVFPWKNGPRTAPAAPAASRR